MKRTTIARRLAERLMLAAERVLPAAKAEWGAAMRSELEHVDGDRAALAWALGCWFSCLKTRVGEVTVRHERMVGFGIAFIGGAAIWVLSPFVTGHAEPWDADSAFYVTALFVVGAIAGFLLPSKIAPVWPGIALGQLAYTLLVFPVGPLWFVGFGLLFVYGLVALAAAFASSRLRRLWRRTSSTPSL